MLAAETMSAVEAFNARSVRECWQIVCDDRLAFDSPNLVGLPGIWNAVRGAREMPMREDFTARILGRHLQYLTFVERENAHRGHRYRFRLFGSALARYIGDCTGRYLDEVVPPNFAASWYATYDLVIETRKPLRFVSQFHATELEHVQAECFVAPLAGETAGPWGLLASVVYSPVVV